MVELLVGIALYGLLCQLVGLFLPVDRSQYAAGLWIGIVTALAYAGLLYRSVGRSIDTGGARAPAVLGFLSRYLLAAGVIVLVYYTEAGYILATGLGILGVKIGAYAQPLVHILLNKLLHETDPVPEPSETDGRSD